MERLSDIVYAAFKHDLERDGDFWRVWRPSTFTDILLIYRKKIDVYTHADLISIVNWTVRYSLCKQPFIDISNLSLEAVHSKFETAEANMLSGYMSAFRKMTQTTVDYRHTSLSELSQELDYLTVLGQLDLDADFDVLMNRIGNMALALLATACDNQLYSVNLN